MQLDMEPPPGPPEYQAGYIDGCSTGLTENDNLVAQLTLGEIMNPVLAKESALYRSVWRSAYIYCYLYVPSTTRNYPGFFKPDFRFQLKFMPGTARKAVFKEAPPGPENFRIGWRHGCSTGKAASGTSAHRFSHKFVKDSSFIEGDRFNSEYEKGWETAFWVCQRYFDLLERPSRKAFF